MDEDLPLLPRTFPKTVASGDLARMIAVFDRYDVNARTSKGGGTALAVRGVPPELMRWLVAHGADPDRRSADGVSPLRNQIDARDAEAVRTLLDLGADTRDMGSHGEDALRYAATWQRPAIVRVLLERPRKRGLLRRPKPPTDVLTAAIESCPNALIPETVETVELLLAAGATVTGEARAAARRIGETFERMRDAYDRESLPAADAALRRLYELTGVDPVPPVRRHDGVSRIEVPTGRLSDQIDALWDDLVPAAGAAATAQGEAVRIVGRVTDELLRNGGNNWDDDYRAMLRTLPEILASGTPLPDDALQEVRATARRLPRGEAESLTRVLDGHVVEWIRANPVPVPPPSLPYGR